ncbi:hypothetical protein NADFUDRAFT_52480 [Nadsonia fulvescens var. elongata DSM 6958]|uniref:Uncharacterized protein n=1 Tax=Nadsonia fulvescens var. elongata DSM 6958 TaxID=857566 RepID=A0A1E3PFR1_9ASCO|nr:hypothetical protein NADFUDRAFT_52480 [Nadsonia fulvescens var. elongata DSM 6958]
MAAPKPSARRARTTVKTFPVVLKVPSAILRQVADTHNAQNSSTDTSTTAPTAHIVVKLPPFKPKGFAAVNLGSNVAVKCEQGADDTSAPPSTSASQPEIKTEQMARTTNPTTTPKPPHTPSTTTPLSSAPTTSASSVIPQGTKPPPKPRGRRPGQIYSPRPLTPKPANTGDGLDDVGETGSSLGTPLSTAATTPIPGPNLGGAGQSGPVVASSIITGPRIAGLKSLPLSQQTHPLDRSGEPCRRWVKAKVELKSFTGVKWEISGVWNGGPTEGTHEIKRSEDETKIENKGKRVETADKETTKPVEKDTIFKPEATGSENMNSKAEIKQDEKVTKLAPIILKLNPSNNLPITTESVLHEDTRPSGMNDTPYSSLSAPEI